MVAALVAVSRILVTGATDGLGLALARELVRAGHEVVIHGRNAERGKEALRQTGAREWAFADFASLDSVRALGTRLAPVDVLVNNAGIGTNLPGGGARLESKDGLELRFQVNYLAGYLLAKLLAPPHVVNVASAGQAPIDFADVMLTSGYSGPRAYAQSKLAQVMHVFDLAEAGVIANALHPATYMPTKMVIAARGSALSTLEEGVEATLALVQRTDVSGRFFNGLRESRADEQAYDAEARRRLRALSDELVGGEIS
jgi:NAD(P)-dependent dehydrogenase (short-subunit alcohol dehydrogenase family)